MKLRLREVHPIARRGTVALVDRRATRAQRRRGDDYGSGIVGGLEVVTLPVYPPSPHGAELRQLRTLLGLSIGEAARALGVSAVELSDLERGRRVPVDPSDWKPARAVLSALERGAVESATTTRGDDARDGATTHADDDARAQARAARRARPHR